MGQHIRAKDAQGRIIILYSGEAACLVDGDVVVVISKRRLDLNADLLEAQQLIAHHCAHNQVPARTSHTSLHLLLPIVATGIRMAPEILGDASHALIRLS